MLFVYILLGFLGILLVVLLLNTWVQVSKARRLVGAMPEAADEDLKKYAETLQKMIQCRTVSVKDAYDDTEFAKQRTVVRRAFPLLHEKAQHMIFSQDCWMYKIPGKDKSRNILLMSHHDVVAADFNENWKYEPFSGTIADGKVWGRGAADTKGSLCGILYAMEELLEEGFTPEVNVYIGSSHNEELGGAGITSALAYFREHGIRFEVILDEGGAIIDPPLGKMKCSKCAMVAVHEKGRLRLICKATSESSHISLTGYKNNPVERMAEFIQKITSKNRFIRRLHPQVQGMFKSLAPYCGFPMNVLFCNLWLFSGLLKKVLPKINATAGDMLGTNCSFQNIQGGMNDKICTAKVMLRNINEEDLNKDFEAFKKIAADYGIEVEVEHREYYPPVDMESPAYAYAMDCIAKVFPEYPAAPYILPAGTDAWKLTPICSCVLRFAPTRMSKQQLGSIHAVNENLDIAAVYEAAVFYKTFVKGYR